VSWSPDGKSLASTSWDQTVRLWEGATGQQRAVLKGHTGGVLSVSWSPDGKALTSASGEVKVWDARTATGWPRSRQTAG
jgi:WD40 repeat protein